MRLRGQEIQAESMTTADHDKTVGDEKLVAFLDGMLDADEWQQVTAALVQDPELRKRKALLERGNRPFRAAFDLLLQQVPQEPLQAMLAKLDQQEEAAVSRPAHRRWSHSRVAAAAVILLAVFMTGLAGGYFAAVRLAEFGKEANWRDAVASYMVLYTRTTVEAMPDSAGARSQELAAASEALGLEFSTELISAPGVEFKGARLLDYDGNPLAQFIYLARDGNPIAFCVIRDGEAPDVAEVERRRGMTLVYWSAQGYEFMVIGKAPQQSLMDIANHLKARFS